MKELPKFKVYRREDVIIFVERVFSHPNKPEESFFRYLVEYDDGHYGAEFSLDYFINPELPTKSQWNGLKKKMRRHNKRVFVFKEYKLVSCDDPRSCGFVEFGFFAD